MKSKPNSLSNHTLVYEKVSRFCIALTHASNEYYPENVLISNRDWRGRSTRPQFASEVSASEVD